MIRLLVSALAFFSTILFADGNQNVTQGLKLFGDWVESQIERNEIPGACVALVYKDQIIWGQSYGYSSLAPKQEMSLETIFPIASLTKPFTASALMNLWQDGKVDLNASIDKYLPVFSIKGYSPETQPITIFQLLNHTSGLPQDADFPYWNDLEFPSFHAMWQKLQEQSLVYSPGSHWKYSNLGYALLGKIIEVISWKAYSDFLQKVVFDPLEMSNTTFRPPRTSSKIISQGYSRIVYPNARKLVPIYETNGLKPALGLYSDIKDLARFASLFLSPEDSKGVLSSPTRRFMTKPTVEINPQMNCALGFVLRRQGPFTLVEHPGSLPGFSAYISLCPIDSCGLIVLCNSQEWLMPWANEAVRWVFTNIRESSKQPLEYPDVPSVWHKYVGKYSNREGDVYVEIYRGKLVLYQPLRANMLDPLVEQEDHTFRIVHGYTFNSSNGDTVSFQLDKNENVEWMKIANMYLYPQKK